MDEAISAAGKTRKGVAMEFGFTVGNFGSWKSRGDYPKVDMAFKIAQYVGTTVEYLMTGERKARYGLPPRVADIVEDLLGHSDYETTAGYLHTPMDMINRITESLDKVHGDDQDNPSPS